MSDSRKLGCTNCRGDAAEMMRRQRPHGRKPPGDMVAEVERIARITGNKLLARAGEWLRAERQTR